MLSTPVSKIKAFFSTFRAASTVNTYSWILRKFFHTIYGDGDVGQQAERYFSEKRDYQQDVETFFAEMKDSPPMTVSSSLSCVRSFFLHNHVELPQWFWRSLSRRKHGTGAVTEDRVPMTAELRSILNFSQIQGKTLFMVLASSGMRLGETLQLKIEDVDLHTDPVRIHIRHDYTKNGNRRLAFISTEAKEVVQQWLKVRQQYLVSAAKKCKQRPQYKTQSSGKSTDDPRLFPFDKSTAHLLWATSIRKAELNKRDPSTNRYELHIHCLRKLFITQVSKVTTKDVAEALVGHEGYLTGAYRRYTPEELAEEYKKIEPAIRIFATAAEDTGNVRRELLDKTNALEQVVHNLTVQNEQLKSDFEFLQLFLGKQYQDYQNDMKHDKKYQKIKRDLLAKNQMKKLKEY